MSALIPGTRRERAQVAIALRADGLTYKQIADRIGCTISTARSLVTDPEGKANVRFQQRTYIPAEPDLLTSDSLDVPALSALAVLTPAEREAFIDNAMLGQSFEQIGERSGVSRSAVSKSAERARLKLAGLLFPHRFSTGTARSDLDGGSAGRATGGNRT